MNQNKTSSSWIIKELDNISSDTSIEEVIKLIREYYKISPNTYFTDITERYKENDEIGPTISGALMTFYTHKTSGMNLDQAIARQIESRKKQPVIKRKKSLSYDHGLNQGMYGIKTKNHRSLVKSVADVVKNIGYIIPRCYSVSDIFDPRLFIIGYVNRRSNEEISSIQEIVDQVIEAGKRVLLVIDCKEGFVPQNKLTQMILKTAFPPIEKYANNENIEIFGVDNARLLEARGKYHLDYKIIAQMRLNGLDDDSLRAYLSSRKEQNGDELELLLKENQNPTIIDNLKNMHREYPDHNIVALLASDISLEQHSLYKALEEYRIPYMVMFPRAGMFWKDSRKTTHMNRLKDF